MAVLSLPRRGLRHRASAQGGGKPEPVLTSENAVELCQQLFEEPKEYIDDAAKRRRWDLRRESCKMAFEANPANADLKAAYARNLPYEQKAEAIAMLREAASQGSAEAYLPALRTSQIWDRGDLDKVPLVTRAEADRALHKAAELGHPSAMPDAGTRLDGWRHRETRYRRRAILGGTCRRQPRPQSTRAKEACW